MAPLLLLFLLTMALVEVDCFRTPLPFGTGFPNFYRTTMSATQDNELSGQGIFHLMCNAFKYAFPTILEGNNSSYLHI